MNYAPKGKKIAKDWNIQHHGSKNLRSQIFMIHFLPMNCGIKISH